MPNKLLSAVLVFSCGVLGGLMGDYLCLTQAVIWTSAAVGSALGLAVIALLRVWLRLDVYRIVGGAAGTLVGAVLALIVYSGFSQNIQQPEVSTILYALLTVVFTLVGLQLGASKARELRRKPEEAVVSDRRTLGILDTSVIIDGRIADVCETGFVSGDLIIPEFVLKELQSIADSSESTKRTRGRRGLDILNKIRKQPYVGIIIDDTDFTSVKEVDQKLITMAKETGYPILTNDFNLNKVAEVHAIQVLNINQLANALKPIVLPGEHMRVQIMKEGKEPGQGLAYLDDGTMVVVDNGRKFMGRTVEVTVTSVLQTPAGRMIFASLKS